MISGIELNLQGWLARISDEGFIRFVCDMAVRLGWTSVPLPQKPREKYGSGVI
jgi:hypothetical protein